jgi:hypothetical protein
MKGAQRVRHVCRNVYSEKWATFPKTRAALLAGSKQLALECL